MAQPNVWRPKVRWNTPKLVCCTVVGDVSNIIKTTFKFGLYLAFEKHRYTKTWKQREAVNFKNQFSLITSKLVIRKKLLNNKNLNKKVVFIIDIIAYHRMIKTVNKQ